MTDHAPATPTTPTHSNTDHEPISRRTAIAAIGVAGAAAVTAHAQDAAPGRRPGRGGRSRGAQPDDAQPRPYLRAWDPGLKVYTLPDLPYAYDALEPYIDAQTMRIHHDMHHAGYVKGANNALAKLEAQRNGTPDPSMVEYWSNELTFNVGGHINHTLFWSGMAAPSDSGGAGGRGPDGHLRDAIREAFGTFEKFKAQFTAAAKSVEGSGWAWLVRDRVSGQLLITQMHNQQKSMFVGAIPLLGIDVWEHAYYLKYQNKRADYIDAWWNVVNWDEVARR